MSNAHPPSRRARLRRLLALNPFAVAALIASIVVFSAWPQLDLAIHRHFFRDGAFYLKDHPLVQFSYQAVPVITKTVVAALALAMLSGAALVATGRRARWLRPSLFLFAALVIGPGLVVNGLFKEHWGRARPSQIQEFMGQQSYSPPWVISDQCASNCSFVSGHAAVGFYFLSVALLLKGRAQAAATVLALLAGLGAGLGRMAQGGHFFSDIIFCGFIVYAISRWLWNLIMAPAARRRPAASEPAA